MLCDMPRYIPKIRHIPQLNFFDSPRTKRSRASYCDNLKLTAKFIALAYLLLG